jgi:predicted enzyme related to lactoylglutathione lyase
MAHGDITHIDIPADDVGRASAFYGAVFGWSIAEVPGYEGYPMWRAPNGISGGGIAARQGSLTYPRSYVEVDSIDAVSKAVEANGGSVTLPKSAISDTSWYAVINDTEGNQIGLFEGTV